MLNKSEFHSHLVNDLIPFWNNLHDSKYGGFYGSVDSENNISKTAPKSSVLQTRILWFYSSCYKILHDRKLLEFANQQFDFISECMLDPDDNAIYWSVNYDGTVRQNQKHTYALAFALYSLSAYYSVSRNESALLSADRIFELIENKFKDEYGYIEPLNFGNPNGGTTRTMNTLLHIIEAYTEYFRTVRTDKAKYALEYALNLVISKAYNDDLYRIECYFDELMNPTGDLLSYGHDIESSWLIYRACEILNNKTITEILASKLEKVAQNVILKGFVNEGKNGIYYDCKNGINNEIRSWWVMSEAIVALVHQYRLYGRNHSMTLAENVWNYTKEFFISPYGEWYSIVDDSGKLVKNSSGLCGSWKCPYHNGRMCLELIEMLK